MTSDQIESRMNFIIEQQARFAVDIQQLQEAQARTHGTLRNLIEVNLSLVGHIQETSDGLSSFITVTEARFKETDEKIGQVVEGQVHTDERVSADPAGQDEKRTADLRCGFSATGLRGYSSG